MDISALRDRNDAVLTVTELNNFIKNMLDSSRLMNSVHIRGEISNFVNHRSGHFYFSLKDEGGQIKAIMFRSAAIKLKFVPENGMKVTVYGSVSVFVRDGVYQIYVTSMQPDGIGALYLAYEQLKAKLESEGLFSEYHKKSLPEYPEKIGVITSATGAAVRDIINVIGRRYPLATIFVYPALVQGDGAAKTLIEGIDYFDKSGLVDVVIIGRGGGSIEDLWEFNNEELARRIFDCSVPVISAVGHETDFTICDFVSDMRAPTPSAAAEIAVPDIREIVMRLDSISDRADRALIRLVERSADRLKSLLSSRVLSDFKEVITPLRSKVDELERRCTSSYELMISENKLSFLSSVGKLEALNPLAVLSRGYSVVRHGSKTVASIDDLSVGDSVDVRVTNGSFRAFVESKTKN